MCEFLCCVLFCFVFLFFIRLFRAVFLFIQLLAIFAVTVAFSIYTFVCAGFIVCVCLSLSLTLCMCLHVCMRNAKHASLRVKTEHLSVYPNQHGNECLSTETQQNTIHIAKQSIPSSR